MLFGDACSFVFWLMEGYLVEGADKRVIVFRDPPFWLLCGLFGWNRIKGFYFLFFLGQGGGWEMMLLWDRINFFSFSFELLC